jgi:adenylate cyclase
VTSLARLLTRVGRGSEVRSTLQNTYEWFSEGFDTADLREARNALDAI